MQTTVSAGGIFVKKENGKYFLLLAKYKNIEGLGFLKGHAEPGESVEQTAIRETKEEAGLSDVRIIKKLFEYIREATNRENIPELKTIHMFLMETDHFDHQNAEEDFGWYEFDDAVSKMSFPIEAEFLRKHRAEIAM